MDITYYKGRWKKEDKPFFAGALKPENTRRVFAERGWKTVVGFQTRNPIHKAHEHIQRIGLEVCDGLFINPIAGWKKPGDFTQVPVRQGCAEGETFQGAGRESILTLK